MLRIGIVDFDTSHVVEFTKRINHIEIAEDQWVEGARVVAGVPGTSLLSPERVPGYTAQLKAMGVPLFERATDIIDKIDAVMIESVDGSVHLERARPFLERGMPTFVDKPFACSVADAEVMVDLAARTHTPLFSSSSLRYATEVHAAIKNVGTVLGAATYGPAPLDATGRNPGLFHYGIHPVEMLYTVLGSGCQSVSCAKTEGAELVTGVWRDGRVGSVRGLRAGRQDYGLTVFCDNAVTTANVSTQYIYRDLLNAVIRMFESGKPPIEPSETLEIVTFIAGALESANRGGVPVALRNE